MAIESVCGLGEPLVSGAGRSRPLSRRQDHRRDLPPRHGGQDDPRRSRPRDRARRGASSPCRRGRDRRRRCRDDGDRRAGAHRAPRRARGGLAAGRRVRRRPASGENVDAGAVPAGDGLEPQTSRAGGPGPHGDAERHRGVDPQDAVEGAPAWRRTTDFPSLYDIEPPEGAEGWEELYNWYHLRGDERRESDEQRFWFQDRLHHPEAMHPYDEIQCECWWQALGAFNTRIFAMPPAYGIDQRVVNGYLYISPIPAPPEDIEARAAAFGERRRALLRQLGRDLRGVEGQDGRPPRADEGDAVRAAARPRGHEPVSCRIAARRAATR